MFEQPVFWLVAVGAAALIALLVLRAFLPTSALWVLAILAIATGFAAVPAGSIVYPAVVPIAAKIAVMPARPAARWLVPASVVPAAALGWSRAMCLRTFHSL